jgi:ABC-2 type transport system permease protein
MMKALSIALKDLQILFKDRGAVIELLVLPLLFIVVFSGALGAIGQSEEEIRIPLPVVDLDGGESSVALLSGLIDAGGVEVQPYDEAEAAALLDEGSLQRVLTVPADFSSGIAEGRTATLRLVSHPDADRAESEAVRLVVVGVAQDMSLESQVLASLRQMGDMMATAPEEVQQAFGVERMQEQARSQFETAQDRPLVSVIQTIPQAEAEREEEPDLNASTVPGFAVLFIFLTAQTTARSIYEEKKVGSFRRLLAAPMGRAALLAGKMLPNVAVGIVQTVVIFSFGTAGLSILGLTPVSLGSDPLAAALVLLVIIVCSSSLGLVIAALARTENQIGGLSSLLLWGLGLISGAVVPLFLLERVAGPVLRVIPHYWANLALEDLMVRGLGFTDVTTEIGVLLGFTALFFVVGLWRFEFE